MQNHERRSCAPPPPAAPPHRWERPDAPRITAPLQVLLAGRDFLVPELEAPESLTRLDHTMLLPCEVRQDIVRGAL